MADLERMVQRAIDIANDDSIGYSQPHRMEPGYIDCSEMVRQCLVAGGFSAPSYMWTGNEYAELTRRGWVFHAGTAGVRRGDILWGHRNGKGHTSVCIGGGRVAEAWGSEHGTVDGAPGDQTGREVRIGYVSGYSKYDGYFRFEEDIVTDEDIRKIAEAVVNYDLNGVKLRDRIIGTDQAANSAPDRVWNYKLNGTLARDRLIGTDIAANTCRKELTRTDDPSGRGTKATLYERVAWLGSKADVLHKALQEAGQMLTNLKASLGNAGK